MNEFVCFPYNVNKTSLKNKTHLDIEEIVWKFFILLFYFIEHWKSVFNKKQLNKGFLLGIFEWTGFSVL